jgi:sulfur carrier protein
MRVVLRNPRREVEVAGGRRVSDVLKELAILPETVLVIRGDELLTGDSRLGDDDTIELRPVMSGGAGGPTALRSGGTARPRASGGGGAASTPSYSRYLLRSRTSGDQNRSPRRP